MKTLLLILSLLALIINNASAQNPDLISASANEEGAITLHWQSRSNAVYRIECADQLLDQGTVWESLYNNYPTHGTNTFWLDTGNYYRVPPILHPKHRPTRFYRIVEEGMDTATDKPSVAITFPTNGFIASGDLTITVAATTQLGTLETKLYVDGQEMNRSQDGSNYVINTCEWANGTHTLFATAESMSSFSGGGLNASAPLIGRSVSSYVSVVFSNLVTMISFSEPFFEPALGQTQKVSAVFAANVDWTLQIKDTASNVVRTATGSGTSLHFEWDGKGDGGTNLVPALYYFYILAETNGLAYSRSPEEGSGGDVPLPPSFFSENSDYFEFALPPLPPGLSYQDENGEEVLTMKVPKEPYQLSSQISRIENGMMNVFGGASTQAAPAAPKRPPPVPGQGKIGTFGIGYQTYKANGASGFTPPRILATGGGLQTYMTFEGKGSTPNLKPLDNADVIGLNFMSRMEKGKWKNEIFSDNDHLKIEHLRGTGNPFNAVNIGLLVLHCVYGDKMDLTSGAGGAFQMYFPITAGTGAQYLRMSEMKFGGADTNGLKWMALLGCHTLYHVNWNSMKNAGVKPYNNNLRLLLGTDTDIAIEPSIGERWAEYMMKGTNGIPLTIKEAWYLAGRKAYEQGVRFVDYSGLIPMSFAVAGDSACMGDYLESTNNPALSGSWTYDPPRQVYP